MPLNIDFPGKQKDEVVKMFLRKHPFILIRQNLIYLFYFSVPVILYILGREFFSFILSFPIYPIFALITSLYYSYFLLFLLIEWMDYYFDAWIITNRRLIDVEQTGLFQRTVSETRLEKIQDVSFEVKGILGTMLNYGSINVQTAGAAQNFIINKISDPAQIKTQLLTLYDQRTQNMGAAQKQPAPPRRSTASTPNQPPNTGIQNRQSAGTPLSTPQAPGNVSSENVIQDIKKQ